MSQMIYALCILGLFAIIGLMFYAYKALSRGWTLKILFKDFRRKIWMTLGLGMIFFSLYLFAVYLCAHCIYHWNINLFQLLHQNLSSFVYAGLGVFACLSLSIYFARMIIKYFYLTRGKDGS